jgi:pilus assembly protein CpaE
MEKNLLVLLISGNSAGVESLSSALWSCGCLTQRAFDLPTALARIGGGGVGAALLDLSASLCTDETGWNGLRKLRQQASRLPVIVFSDVEDSGRRARSMQLGAAGYVTGNSNQQELIEAVRAAILQIEVFHPKAPATVGATRRASVVAVLGAKGGVGTTTVALNVATVLAKTSTVILAEIRPMLGSLAHYFRPSRTVRQLSELLTAGAAALPTRTVESCLWPSAAVPGLSLLFGPQTAEDCREINADLATSILESLACLADYVVVDLPATLSPANRAVLRGSDYLALVVEREPVCVEAAKFVLATIQKWDVTPAMSGMVIVNRASLVAPLPIPEIEEELGSSILEVITPAPDLCFQSQKARTPMVELDPESLVAQSLVALSKIFHKKGRSAETAGLGDASRSSVSSLKVEAHQ